MTPRPEPETRARILKKDAEQIRRWREQDERNGMKWEDSSGWTGAQGRREANNLPSAAA